MKICIIEACRERALGSIGAWYIAEHAKRIGYQVDFFRNTKTGYDVELISVHHCTDFERLARMPKRAKIRIVGGHPMVNNPRPIIPFADAVCVGEGESWIKQALFLLEKYETVDALADLPGTIISRRWQMGDKIPAPNIEKPLPDNLPYLNRPNTRSAAWYLEIARGCPYKCLFCELGHSLPFRLYSMERIKVALDQIDTKLTRKINFYAPDEAAHPNYQELYDYLAEKGYMAGFSSMRIDSIMKRDIPKLKRNVLIRVGIDGLSERIRKKVNKPISDDIIVEYFRTFIERGHVRFKMFFIFGYPWETLGDFICFENLMHRIFKLPLRKNVSLRIKWTPFIPQPCTPIGKLKARYNHDMVDKINTWHALNARPRTTVGWYVENDGLMSYRNHRRQCELTAGDERILVRSPEVKALYKI